MSALAGDSFGPTAGSVRHVVVLSATLDLLTMTSSLTGSLLLPAGGPHPG
jgi:hypothetical protein